MSLYVLPSFSLAAPLPRISQLNPSIEGHLCPSCGCKDGVGFDVINFRSCENFQLSSFLCGPSYPLRSPPPNDNGQLKHGSLSLSILQSWTTSGKELL